MIGRLVRSIALASLVGLSGSCGRDEAPGPAVVRVAVAANFARPFEELAELFARQPGGCRVESSSGSTGALYAQIVNGAPFDAFLAADRERPERLAAEGHAVAGTLFVYARGRLALVGGELDDSDPAAALLRDDVVKVAIANPRTAPYGAAALEVLAELGLTAAVEPKLVLGTNVAQALQYVDSGAAELGFVALADALEQDGLARWTIPEELHAPIRQGAVLVRDRPGAARFLAFLRSPEARRVLERRGYSLEG